MVLEWYNEDTLYLPTYNTREWYISYHSGEIVRILLENILKRYFIKVRKFWKFLENINM